MTLEGELFEPDGTVSGGKKQGQVGIISRKSELTKIAEELAIIKQTLENLVENRQTIRDELTELEGETPSWQRGLNR